MAKGIWRRVGNTAVPVGANSLAYLHAFKDGQEFIAETKAARNVKQLRLWWTLCRLVAENDREYDTEDKASEGIKRALHHVETFVDRHGTLHIKPKSIAFESMAQEDFDRLFKDAINVIAGWLGSSPTEVMDHFNSMVGDKRGYQEMRRR